MGAFMFWVLFGGVTSVVAMNKGRNGFGWLLIGALLGPFGLILCLFMPKNQPADQQESTESGSENKSPDDDEQSTMDNQQ